MANSIIPPSEQCRELTAIDGMAMRTIAAGRRTFFVEVYDKSMESNDKDALSEGEKAFAAAGSYNLDTKYASGDAVIAIVPGYEKTLIRKFKQTAVGADGDVSFDLAALNPDFDSVKDAHLRGAIIVARVIGAYRSL